MSSFIYIINLLLIWFIRWLNIEFFSKKNKPPAEYADGFWQG